MIKRIFGPDRIAIIGAGEFGNQAAHYICQNDRNSLRYEIAGWYDDRLEKGKLVNRYRVLGEISSVMDDYEEGKFEYLFIAIGYNHPAFKDSLIKQFKNRIPLYNIISPETYIDPTSIIGENIFIYPGAIIDKQAKLNDGVTVNLGSIVSHNSEIGTCSFIAPGVTVAGFTHIGKHSFLGAGSVVKDNVTICEDVTIGAGAVVVRNLTERGIYAGVPARKIK